MSLLKFIKAIVFCTILALIYINMRMQIIAMAYEGKKREQEIISFSERNGVLAYEILSLKSANNLGDRVLGNQSQLRFCDNKDVVKLMTAKPEALQKIGAVASQPQRTNLILSFFSKSGAEASAAEATEVIKPWRRSR